jgi:hypothetical protein
VGARVSNDASRRFFRLAMRLFEVRRHLPVQDAKCNSFHLLHFVAAKYTNFAAAP